MGRVIRGARRVPAAAVAAYDEASAATADARRRAERIAADAEAEAEAIREDARRDGVAEGAARAAAAIDAALAERREAIALREADVIDTAVEVARRVLLDRHAADPDLAARRAAEVIRERFFGDVTVRIAPGEPPRWEPVLARAAPGRAIRVREDPDVPPGGCVVEGGGGEVRLVDAELLARVARRLRGPAEEER
jgi:flagellar biosynthesis/type III secretory pathway protein FliH